MSARDVLLDALMETARGTYDARTDALIAALAARGYVIVPREPTREMMDAADAVKGNAGYFANVWTAFLSAALPGGE